MGVIVRLPNLARMGAQHQAELSLVRMARDLFDWMSL
jgi:hypothetical protein